MQEREFILGFSAFPGIATRRLALLVAHFGSAQKAWNGLEDELEKILGKAIGGKFIAFRKKFDIPNYATELKKKDIHFFIPSDKEYPFLLQQLPIPPFILFAKGNIALLNSDKTIGIVGTRKATPYGVQVTEMLTRDLVVHGFVIVSGMAMGVDGIAHREAIKQNGATIAVLGSGVDMPTPREHAGLYKEILDNNGVVVSTFSPGEDASKGSFPARNAIIAGMSLATVVTEGAEDSGSLITAEYSRKFARPIFAVPGQIISLLSKGTNNLIKHGAIPITSAHDIIEHLKIDDRISKLDKEDRSLKTKKGNQHSTFYNQLSKEERVIIELLETGPLHFDEIVRTIGKSTKETGSLLSMMELKGLIKNNGVIYSI